MPLFVLEPPVDYVHHYNGAVIERVLPLSEARKACAGRCLSLHNSKHGPVRNRAAYRHELAHCNGWDPNSAARGPASEQDPLKAIR
jgi:hypothetical protein